MRPSLWVLLAALLTACAHSDDVSLYRHLDGADASRGKEQIKAYGCGSCHVIPGVAGAHGTVGPPLTGWSERRVIAGEVPNTPENLVFWITVPQSIEPGTVMPNLGVSAGQARDIAEYLNKLR